MNLVDIVGARPQFVKVGAVLRAIERHNHAHPRAPIREVLVHTGQHYDPEMSQVFFDELEIKRPDYHLGVGSGTHAFQTGEMLKAIEHVLVKERPDVVVVYGDTNSTLAGALAAAKLRLPGAHVEAGLRSFNKAMPEEVNRVVADHLADLLFCPTETAVHNLAREGITRGVYLVGDVMHDSVLHYGEQAERRSRILERLRLERKGYALATVHRAENTDDAGRLQAVLRALDEIAGSGLPVVVPLHPRTRARLQALPETCPRLRLMDPVSYLDMLMLERHAKVIITDSGGVQKEAYFFQVPCVTLRDETEWVETVHAGWNVLVGARVQEITHAVRGFSPPAACPAFYGNGQAADQVVQRLLGDRPQQ